MSKGQQRLQQLLVLKYNTSKIRTTIQSSTLSTKKSRSWAVPVDGFFASGTFIPQTLLWWERWGWEWNWVTHTRELCYLENIVTLTGHAWGALPKDLKERPAMRLKYTLVLVERSKIASVSALSHCRLSYTLWDFTWKSVVELTHFGV